MGRPALDPARFDDAIASYRSGKPRAQVCAEFGISKTTLSEEIKRRGIEPHGGHTFIDGEAAAARYLGGESELAIARTLGVSRTVVARALKQMGIERRDPSEAQLLRMGKLGREERLELTAAAHAASEGRVPSEREMMLRADARERNGWTGRTSDGERTLDAMLRERGVEPVREKAIGRYNVDFAVGKVAVELLGGGWHAGRASFHEKRGKYILDRGWLLLYLWDSKHSVVTGKAADKIVALAKQAGRDPSLVGKNGVIRGDGEFVPRGGLQEDRITLVSPTKANLYGRSRD